VGAHRGADFLRVGISTIWRHIMEVKGTLRAWKIAVESLPNDEGPDSALKRFYVDGTYLWTISQVRIESANLSNLHSVSAAASLHRRPLEQRQHRLT
jgi:hypothetical protein